MSDRTMILHAIDDYEAHGENPASWYQARDAFIAEHIKTCTAQPCRKYDPKKPGCALHTVEYTRRKCAKNIWKRRMRRLREQNGGDDVI